jgi:hypothetical protein
MGSSNTAPPPPLHDHELWGTKLGDVERPPLPAPALLRNRDQARDPTRWKLVVCFFAETHCTDTAVVGALWLLHLALALAQTPALRAAEQDGEDQALVHLALPFVSHVPP